MDEDRSFWLSEYQNVSQQFQKFLDLYIKMFALYVGIIGVLFKFALDQQSTSELRRALGIYMMVLCALFALGIAFAEIMTRRLRRKRKATLDALGKQTWDEFVAGHWASIGFSLFTLFLVLAVLTLVI